MKKGGMYQGWKYGQLVMVVGDLDVSKFSTLDVPPEIGTIGAVSTINIMSGVVVSAGVSFGERSWVYPVEMLYNPEAENNAKKENSLRHTS